MDDPQTTTPTQPDIKALAKALFSSGKELVHRHVGYLLLVPLLVVGFMAFNFYSQYQLFKNNPQAAAAKENQKLVAEISHLILLPSEQPTVATVSDLESVKNQPFFAQAKLGDKVLIFTNAKKAVLYDPVSRRVIEVAPLNVGDSQVSPQ